MNRMLPLLGAAAVLLAGCATDPAAPGAGDPPQDLAGFAAAGRVVGQGTVIQAPDGPPELCLGGVLDSYPPQCAGPVPLAGWDWDAVEGEDSASGVTWGAYAVWGEWDGAELAVDDVVLLALYDPMPRDAPLRDPANAGDAPEAELLRIQEGLFDAAPFPVLGSWPENGYLFVTVIYDDGRIQDWFDAEYGPEKISVVGALQDADDAE